MIARFSWRIFCSAIALSAWSIVAIGKTFSACLDFSLWNVLYERAKLWKTSLRKSLQENITRSYWNIFRVFFILRVFPSNIRRKSLIFSETKIFHYCFKSKMFNEEDWGFNWRNFQKFAYAKFPISFCVCIYDLSNCQLKLIVIEFKATQNLLCIIQILE